MNQTIPGAAPGPAAQSALQMPGAKIVVSQPNVRALCDTVPPAGAARCNALLRTDIAFAAQPNVAGFGPPDIQSAYQLPSATKGKGQVVGIVDAYDDPNAEADLQVYRSNFGLPTCNSQNGCFKKVNQTGSPSKYPAPNSGWAGEISLDLDMVSAACPNCKIILVEANSNYLSDLAASVDEAVLLGAKVVSNSYGAGEGGAKNTHYHHTGVVIVASSGDSGYGAQQPCSYASVVCVGGTSLYKSTKSRGWGETSWGGAGSGCSAYVVKPLWQTDKGCTKRSESDVSAVANPSTGVAFYDTYPHGGWGVIGGTSVASPIIGAVYGLAANEGKQNGAKQIWGKAGSTALNDITSGPSNGHCPTQYPYICTPGVGYDGPTGNGTPAGIAAF